MFFNINNLKKFRIISFSHIYECVYVCEYVCVCIPKF